MTTQAATVVKTRPENLIWIPLGLVLGSVFGLMLKDMVFGTSLGVLGGATVSMAIDHRSGKRSVIWPIVGAFAFVWLVALFFIEGR